MTGEVTAPAGTRRSRAEDARSATVLVSSSILRRADARTKLAISIAASAAVMLPLPQLAAFCCAYGALVVAAGAATQAVTQIKRMRVFLAVLFAVDWIFIGLDFAALISLRLMLLATAFSTLIATTTPDELRTALERMRVPRRFAFTFTAAFGSLRVFEREWTSILEAQRARGIATPVLTAANWREWRGAAAQLVSFVVPAFVLATQRAWAITEAAALRGFESPVRRTQPRGGFAALDLFFLAGTVLVVGVLFACRRP